MSSDRARTGYKETAIGLIPEDWEVKSIGDIGFVSSGGTPSRTNPLYWNGDIPWITTTQIDFNTIHSAEQFITQDGLNNSAAKIFPSGTLLMAMYGQGKTRGKIARLGVEASTNQACAAIALNQNVHHGYIFHYLVSQYDTIRLLSNTGNQENLNGLIIKSIRVPFPPLSEQRSIAEALSDVDALIASIASLITKKRHLKTATMQQLLTGRKRSLEFSDEWQTLRLSDLFEITAGRDLVKGNYSEIDDDIHPYPIYANSVFNGGIYGYSKVKEYEGDCITVTARGTLGVSYYRATPFVAIGRLIVLKPISKVDSFFLSELINHQIKFANESTGVPQLTAPQISKCELSVPRLEEQHAIAKILSDMDTEIAAIETRLAKTQAIKQGMMQQLLTGRIRFKIEA
ncbi:restriction endonuclease subunit S [Leptolyngbya sp. NIES-2104]|uniref:restriction endonuclease subunit S n=1 Tax=Leptolyngbya sp. NIES-2104 TaxID=1552121 RepID=UPI0006ECB068|nr:restriction endonuclease subunit S [Leptolyngbya sp. NIES-2104]GAP99878.1 type I restriction-modification system, specificity subunit S [Leptolyngbya sp. NIES-2104]